MDIAPIIMG